MILTLTTTVAIPALAGQPRHVHHAGAWFADPTGVATHCMSFALWALLGKPQQIEIDFGVTDDQVAGATLDSKPIVDVELERLTGVDTSALHREQMVAARAMPVGHVRQP